MSRSLGAAFLLQAITSLFSGLLLNSLIDTEDINQTMLNIGNHATQALASIIGDIVTALGIIYLGVVLYTVVGRQNKAMALVALGFYVFEAGMLAVSKFVAFVLLSISRDYLASGDEALVAMARLAVEAEDFIYTTHIIPFGLGAILFYYLLYKSGVVPQWLALWGLITVPFVLVGAVWTASGVHVPAGFLALAIPYVPFEFCAGIFILIRGFKLQFGRN